MARKNTNNLFEPKVKYYALATEGTCNIKEGELQVIPAKMVDEVLKTGKFNFFYPYNMHWDTDELKCFVVKETTTREIISQTE